MLFVLRETERAEKMDLHSPLTQVKGIGEKTAALFGKLNIHTVRDLLYHFPRDYEQFEDAVPICDAAEGNTVTVKAAVDVQPLLKTVRSLKILSLTVSDATGTLQLTFFNMPYLRNVLTKGSMHYFHGTVQKKGNGLLLEQPRIYKEDEYLRMLSFVQPKYALTKGVTNQTVLKAMKQVLSFCQMPEHLPKYMLEQYGLMDFQEAMNQIHFPKDFSTMLEARKRLVFDEFFFFLLMLRKTKDRMEEIPNLHPMIETADTKLFLERLSFPLTDSQLQVWEEIKGDLCGAYTMNRLIQGDVGSGKTILAVLSVILCTANGYQAAMMAPTEVLAAQHFDTVTEYTQKYHLPIKPILLVGSMTAAQKRAAYEQIAEGNVNLILGTHALIQDKVNYQRLALVITDEQHRFGVRQREKLVQKGMEPHVLVMSATPIPRTLAMILYGDMHVSVIDKLPAKRLPIKNCVVDISYRKKAYEFICQEVKKGRQAYIICPMVEESEGQDMENVTDYAASLKQQLPSDIQVGCLHGKLRPTEKNRIMQCFSERQIDVLVSTTVVEVGVNVPNATVMMVENAERFGLAQLHQLRGRVGRGEHQSFCIFVNTSQREERRKRLEILNHSNDGFFIAGEDLKLRGPGDLFGILQSGDLAFQIGDIYQDAGILKEASDCVEELMQKDRNLEAEQNIIIKEGIDSGIFNTVDFRSI